MTRCVGPQSPQVSMADVKDDALSEKKISMSMFNSPELIITFSYQVYLLPKINGRVVANKCQLDIERLGTVRR